MSMGKSISLNAVKNVFGRAYPHISGVGQDREGHRFLKNNELNCISATDSSILVTQRVY